MVDTLKFATGDVGASPVRQRVFHAVLPGEGGKNFVPDRSLSPNPSRIQDQPGGIRGRS